MKNNNSICDMRNLKLRLSLLILLINLSAFAELPKTYEEAHRQYYENLRSYTLTNQEKLEKWKEIYNYLNHKNEFNLTALVLYQLCYSNARLRHKNLYQHWHTLLKEMNEKKNDPVVNFLIKKSELEYDFGNRNYSLTIEKGISLIEEVYDLEQNYDEIPRSGDMTFNGYEVIDTVNTIAKASYYVGQYEQAQFFFLKALEGFELIDDKKKVASIYNDLSLIGYAQKNYSKSFEYLDRGLRLSQEIGDAESTISILLNKGIYSAEINEHAQAIKYLLSALEHPQISKYPSLTISAQLALSENLFKRKEFEESAKWINKSIALSKKNNDLFNLTNALTALARIKTKEGQHKYAIPLFRTSLEYYQEKNMKEQESSLLFDLSKAYQAIDDPKNAYKYLELYLSVNEALRDEAQKRSLFELQEKYESNVRKKEIDFLKQENDLKAIQVESEKLQKFNLLLYGLASFIIVLLATGRYFTSKESKRLKKYTEEIESREKQLLLLSNAFENTSDAVWISNAKFQIEVVNDAFEKITGRKNVIGKKVAVAQVHGQEERLTDVILSQAENEGHWDGEIYDQKATGEIYPLELKIEAIKNREGIITHYLGVFRDITKKRKAQEELTKLATHDDLTELPNRVLFKELIQRSFLSAKRNQLTPAVLFINIDGFKKINDSLGHESGDLLLCQFAKRMTETLRSKDIVARVGGDEFSILAEISGQKIDVSAVAKKIQQAFEIPFLIDGRSLKVTTSIGIATYPDDAEDAEELMRKSNIAMDSAKQSGKNRFNFYENHMNDELMSLIDQEQKLVEAIKLNYFEFFYQPIVTITTGKIIGAEALIRWREPNGNLIFPDQFIPFAEKSGLIEQIDCIVIDKVFQQMEKWSKCNIEIKHVSLNLSALIFSKADKLIELLKSRIELYDVSPSKIKVEITEGMLVNDITNVIKTMNRIKSLGFILAIDDFGTGFSSLNYLKQFPIDVLKIDRSFIMDMHTSDKNQSIVRSIIDLAHNLDLSLIAEGVELEVHLSALKDMGCEEYQGYYFSRPIEVDQFEALFSSHPKASTS